MNFLIAVDKWFARFLSTITALLMAAILIVVNVQVFARYFFKFSLGGLSDSPPYIMIFIVWFGAILAARNEEHIKIELLDLVVKNEAVRKVVKLILDFLTALAMAYFTYFAFLYTADAFTFGTREPGLRIPFWILYSILPFCGGFMSVYYFKNTFSGIYRMIKGGNG